MNQNAQIVNDIIFQSLIELKIELKQAAQNNDFQKCQNIKQCMLNLLDALSVDEKAA